MNRQASARPEFDYPLVILVAVLLGMGLVMMFSASYPQSYWFTQNALFWFTKQIMWIAIGLVGLGIALNIDYHSWQKWALPLMGLSLAMLVILLLIGDRLFGSIRQILDGSLQPSEAAKLAVVVYIAAWLASRDGRLNDLSYGLAPFAVIVGLLVALIMAQPNLSTSFIVAFTALTMFFIAGAEIAQILILLGLGGISFALVITQFSYARERVTDFTASFINPMKSPDGHIREAIYALVEGGWFGKGIADSAHKLPGGLPAAHSDSIFAIVGEELGLIGSLLVVALFLFFAYRGARIAMRSPDTFGSLLAIGITTWLVLQAFINIAVITATFPFTGVPLPFFSYGGSSTIINLVAVGILLNISNGGIPLWRPQRNRVPIATPPFRGRDGRPRIPDSGSRRRAPVRPANPRFARFLRR